MAYSAGEICQFRHMLIYLSEQLSEENVQNLKHILKDHLGPDFDRKLEDPLHLFDILEKRRLLNETNVGILKDALDKVGRKDLVEDVLGKYEQEEDFVTQKMNSKSSGLEGPYFGRESLLNSVIGVLNEKQSYIHVVCISGMPGAGKTRLAYEACYRLMQFHQLISVNLREITTIEAAFFAILHRLNVESKTFEPEILLGLVKSFRPSKAGGAIILLDSADHLLDPGTRDKPNTNYEPFIDLISHAIRVMNPLLKIIITSRAGLEKSGLNPKKVTCFSLEGDNELDVEDGVEMMQYYANKTEIDRETCEGLVRFCGKVPLAIKVVGSRFQDGNIKPKELLKYLQNTKSKGRGIIHTLTPLNVRESDQLSVCLESSIRALPEAHKNYLIRLSVIPGTFSIKAARDILDFKSGKKVELQLDLQNIMNRSLLESDRNEAVGPKDAEEDETRYSMHLLLRSFIQQMVLENDEEAKIYREAEKKFISHFGGKLRKICRMMETDYVTALNKKDADYANYQEVLMLLQSSTRYDSPEIAKWLNTAVNHLMVPKNRRTFFQKRAQIMKEQKNMHSYADYKCHEVFQLLLAGEPAEPLLKILDEAEGHLKSLSKKDSEEVQLSLALCCQVRGDVLIGQGRLSETHRRKCAKDAKPFLEKALHIRKKYFGEHFLTARSLLSLGSASQTIGVIDPGSHFTYVHNDMVKALDYYQEALDMVQSIAGSLKHMEAPNILVSMGACMHEMGRHEKAIELYREALTLEEALGVSGTEKTCLLLKNMAMSYYVMERYEDALKLATRALEGRRTLLETHQQTARAIYFVGLINLMLKNYKEARKYFDEALVMEETLWKQGKQHSEDWTRLKERFKMLLEIQDKQKDLRKYKKRFLEAERNENQAERNPEEDKSEEEERGFSSSSSEDETGRRKRKSSSSASSLHSSEEKVPKLESDDDDDSVTASNEESRLAEMLEKETIHDSPGLPPGPPEEETSVAGTSQSVSGVEIKFISENDPDYDDHDSIEECYGINPRRGPYVPQKNKKKTKKASDVPQRKNSDSDDSDPDSNKPQQRPERKVKSSQGKEKEACSPS
ncbi:hypothetical protein HOLleu_26651 [Holothuria leucospilota]|uniref:DED domain-containing protein n=1 Tax=Holothuria leucospilota TaxID=206669 RepID=A0A9Q1BP71_HOLLE|nr:hypothetical protein HOLleu_26651 [Holothuria leucospilota]